MEPYDISKIFNDMELDLIASMKKSLEKGNSGDWQKQKILNLGKYKATNAKIVNGYSSGLGKEITSLLKDSFTTGAKNTDNILKKASKLTKSITEVGSNSFYKINENRMNSLIKSVSDNLVSAEKAMLRQADDVYRQTIFKSQMNLNAGTLSLNQSIDMATRDFLDKGFNCITYSDGRKINIASYAEMALRTSSQRAVFTGEGSRRDEWNVHTVVVSSHSNCSKLCLPWQGKVYIDDVYSSGEKGESDYPPLSMAMNGGLFHPSCKHNMGTYFEGINTVPEQVDNKEALQSYESEQKQRYMERQIRKYKRREAGSLDPQNIKAASDKVKEWQANLKQLLEDNPQLRRDSFREQIKDGLTPKQRQENLNKVAESDRIKETTNKIVNGEYNLKVRDQKQQEHIAGTKQWKDYFKRKVDAGSDTMPTFFSKDVDIQKLINKYKGKGIVDFARPKDLYPREYIDTNKIVGKYWDIAEEKYKDANRFVIIYSSKGVHAFPVRPLKKGE